MNTHRLPTAPVLLLTIFLAVLGTGCPSSSETPSAKTPAASASSSEPTPEPEPTGTEPADEVTYEPAYPADVSTEDLDTEDTAHQQTHSHGVEEHSHGEDDHDHDESGSHEDDHEH